MREINIISVVITLLLFLPYSCKTKDNVNCDAYSKTLVIPYTDTIIMSSLHYHLEEEHICCWVPIDTNIYKDTLYLEINYVR